MRSVLPVRSRILTLLFAPKKGVEKSAEKRLNRSIIIVSAVIEHRIRVNYTIFRSKWCAMRHVERGEMFRCVHRVDL